MIDDRPCQHGTDGALADPRVCSVCVHEMAKRESIPKMAAIAVGCVAFVVLGAGVLGLTCGVVVRAYSFAAGGEP